MLKKIQLAIDAGTSIMDDNDRLDHLSDEHRAALAWFRDRQGQEIGWPEPLNGLFLVNKAKGIHKPAGWDHALSVRISIGSAYADGEIDEGADGSWSLDYFQEGNDPAKRDEKFTNCALMRNIDDRIPVAVLRQVNSKPLSRYRVTGLARVVGWRDGYFRLESFNRT
jgi:putative restriction endonuclease